MSYLIILLVSVLVLAAIVYGYYCLFKIIKFVIDALIYGGVAVYDNRQNNKTLQHYYDHNHAYFDYLNNMWVKK